MKQNSAMTRRMGLPGTPDADAAIDAGLKALEHPSVPHDVRMKAAHPLLLAKHFSSKGLQIPKHLAEKE